MARLVLQRRLRQRHRLRTRPHGHLLVGGRHHVERRDKFRAGGYLSLFLDEAIAQGLADDDKNNSITAIELSQYLHERYRADVKSTRPADVVRTEMTLGYQHLVVDRGSDRRLRRAVRALAARGAQAAAGTARRGKPQLIAFAVSEAPSIIAATGNSVPSFRTPLNQPNVPPKKNIIVV